MRCGVNNDAKYCVLVLCFFESSGKWPKDPGAIQRVKAAFNNAICEELKTKYIPCFATTDYVYALKVCL